MRIRSFIKSILLLIITVFLLGLPLNTCLGSSESSASEDNSTNKIEKEYTQLLSKANDLATKDFPKAIEYCEKAKALLEGAGSFEDKFKVCRDQGYIYEQNNKLNEAIEIYKEAEDYARKSKKTKFQLAIYNDLAIVNRKAGNYQQTKIYHHKCLDLAKANNHLIMEEYSYHGLGYLYETIGDFEKAVEFYFKSLVMAEEKGAKKDVIISLQNISNTYLKVGDNKNALNNINRAYLLSVELNDSLSLARVLVDYGAALNKAGRYGEALEKLQAALVNYEALHQKTEMGAAIIQIIDVYLKEGVYVLAQKYLTHGLELKESMANYDLAQLYQKAGDLYQKLNQPLKAKEAYLNSLEVSDQHDLKVFSEKSNYSLYQLLLKEQNYQAALQYLEKSIAIKDELHGENKNKNVAELQFKYDSEKNEKEIQTLKLEKNKTIFWASMLLFGFLTLAMIFTIRLKIKSNQKLIKKNSEIQNQNIQLLESNEVLSQYAYVAAHDLKEPLRNIGNFINLLQRRYGKDFNKEANEYMTFVKEGAKRMDNLLKDLLEYSTISSQKKGDENVNVREVIENVLLDLSVRIAEKNASVIISDGSSNLIMNRFHLQQLMQNLIGNALKFCTENPQIIIDVQQKNNETIITIEDNGIGMEKEYENKVFKLFQRLNKNNTNFEGNGIGLTICKNIVSKYNGKIWFEPVATGGTKFFISFPQAEQFKVVEEVMMVEKSDAVYA